MPPLSPALWHMSDLAFVHRFVPGTAKRTLLLLHGTGGDENDLLELGRAIDSKAALVSPRGNVLENGAPRFFRRLAEGVFDEADVVFRATELSNFVEAAAQEYAFDLEQLLAIGYSNGANIAAAMLLLGVAKFRSAILFRPMVPLSNVDVPRLDGTRILISAGQFDTIARIPIARRLAQLFEAAGAEVEFTVQRSGHELTQLDLSSAGDWLAR